MKATKGLDRKTRKLFKRSKKEKGLKSLSYILRTYEVGEKVNIILNSQSQKGRPHRRYHSLIGVITKIQGQAYVLDVKQGKKISKIIARPEHLRLAKLS